MNRIDDLIAQHCPDGVRYIEIAQLFSLKNGYTPSKSNASFWTNGTIPWFRMDDIRSHGGILDSSIQSVSKDAVKGGKVFPGNSLLVATSATIGEHALVTVPHLSNQRFTSLSLKPQFSDMVNMNFMYYYGFILDEWCRNNTTTSSFSSVDMAKFKKFRFPVPPLEVQLEIVHILDQFTALEAELEAELEARRRQYEHYRTKALDLSVESNFRWSTLGEISTRVSSGATPKAGAPEYYQGGTIPWLRTGEVNFCDIWETEIHITNTALQRTGTSWIKENCVIVAISGATAAKSAINKIPLTTNQHCCNLQIDPYQADYRYVFHWVSSKYNELKSRGRGARSDLNAKLIKDFSIPIPSLDEQRRIIDFMDRFDSLVNDLSVGLPAELAARRKQYEYYRDKLLTFEEAPA